MGDIGAAKVHQATDDTSKKSFPSSLFPISINPQLVYLTYLRNAIYRFQLLTYKEKRDVKGLGG
ncbi:hypothetical protein BJP34_33710 [Moorena producens PAL-8-15-08-1]|uniref:Uncharacterized protein n=1 Tax=Moorena producens PAL-8-15-08-1 TaxID=1458985 RepID=A0A1D8U1E2_9CYAN|nr:hypothetical protein BJP34_33710 [Moorena producens PAL-8-15-08-1]